MEMTAKMSECRKFLGSFILDKGDIKRGNVFYEGDGKRIGKLLLEDYGRLFKSKEIREATILLKGAPGAMIANSITIRYPYLEGEDITEYFQQRVVILYAVQKKLISDERVTILRAILKNFRITWNGDNVGLVPKLKMTEEEVILDKLLAREVDLGYSNEVIGDKTRRNGYTHMLRMNQGIQLQTWQKKMLFNWKRYNFVAGSRRIGKSQLETDLVLLSDGSYKQAKDLEITDRLMDSDYLSTNIEGLEKGKTKKCYKITLDNGMSKTVTYDHRIPLDSNYKNGKWDINKTIENYKTVEELYNTGSDGMLAVAFNIKDTLIEEYTEDDMMLYGYFLGNGTRGTNYIHGNHPELDRLSDSIHKEVGCNRYKIKGYKKRIGLLGIDELSKDKFVDSKIFRQSNKLKWKVIDGLMNTDGYLGISGGKGNRVSVGRIEYCSVSERLIDDIQLLLYELGVICYKRTKEIRSNYKTDNKLAYYLYITDKDSLIKLISNTNLTNKKNYKEFINIGEHLSNSTIGLIPYSSRDYITNTSRKNKKPFYNYCRRKVGTDYEGVNEYLRYSWHKISKIELAGEQKIVSIKVGTEDELYYINGILTHNTYISSYVAYREIRRDKPGFGGRPRQVLYTCITETKMFQPMQYMLNICKKDIELGYIKYNVKDKMFENMLTGAKLKFITASAKGGAASYGADLVIIDEAAMVSDAFWEDLLPIIVQEGADVYAISTINEDLGQNWFYKKLLEGEMEIDPKIQSIRVTIDDNELLTSETREDMKRELEHNQLKYRTQLYSIFPNGNTVFSLDGVVQPTQEKRARSVIIGYDPGKIIDSAACVIIDVDTLRVIREVEWKNSSYHEQKELLKELKGEYQAHVIMDRTGVGEGVREIMGDLIDASFRYKGDGDLKYNDIHNYYTVSKGDLVETLQLYFIQYGLKINSDCTELINQIKGFKKLTSNGKLIKYGGVGIHDDLVNRLMIGAYYLFHIIKVKEKGLIVEDQFDIDDFFESEFNVEKRFNNYIY